MGCDARLVDIEALAKMAARLAGRDPDEHVRLELADVIAFDDVMWRYPDFLARAEAAYELLTSVSLTRPASFDGQCQSLTIRLGRKQPDAQMQSSDGQRDLTFE